MRVFIFFALSLCSVVNSYGQRTSVYTQNDAAYDRGMMLYEASVYPAAAVILQDYLEFEAPEYEVTNPILTTYADFAEVQTAIRLDRPDAEKLILDFIDRHTPDPIASAALIEVADYYFAAREYDKAIEYYGKLNPDLMTEESRVQSQFNLGYALFVTKEFDRAEAMLDPIARSEQNPFFEQANYYAGMCKFMREDFEGAVTCFKRIADTDQYREYVPYYTAMLYFAVGDYRNVIDGSEPALNAGKVFKDTDTRHLVGKAYFELGEFENAVPYLQHYEQNTEKLSADEFYQLAYAQYQTGDCQQATTNFKQISNLENPMGQRANFYIADCNLQQGELREARNAFRGVSKMTFDPKLAEEALFNFGKLSAQLKFDKEAIQSLYSIGAESPYYTESQNVLNDIFTYTQDYATAISNLEELEALTPKLKEAYQRLNLYHGLQLMQDDELADAKTAFSKSEMYPLNSAFTAQSLFWRGEIAHKEARYPESRDILNKYFTAARNADGLPAECTPGFAHYTQGYNYLRQESYGVALEQFEKSISTLTSDQVLVAEQSQLLPDAYTRAGDCLFKLNRYDEAVASYDKAIAQDESRSVYATFQKAIILGLTNQPYDKIVLLADISDNHPNSQYADDALFELADTYQQMQSTDKAIPILRRIISEHPTSEFLNTAYLRLGLISFNNGDLVSAIDNYKSVFQHNPSPTEAREALAALEEIYVTDLAKPDEFFAFAETVPGYEVSTFRRDSVSFRTAEIQYENAEYAKAIASFDNYLSNFPEGTNRLTAQYFKAESYVILKNYDSALTTYDDVLDNGASRYYQKSLVKAASICYHHKQDFNAAYGYYQRYAEITTDSKEKYDAQLGMLRSAYRVENWAIARDAGMQVLNYADASQDELAEAHFSIAKAAYETKDYDAALRHFNEVTKLSNNIQTAEARVAIATVYYTRNQLELSEQMAHNANAENANYPFWVAKGLILLSDIYLARDDFFNAKAPLEAILENFEPTDSVTIEAKSKLDYLLELEDAQSRLKTSTDTLEMDKNNNNDN